ncbi:DUF4395 domain-containing protein [Kineosporia sp. R_H_3]|uniref:DUF4395 domain-containing protein n=1 Tax=Kineosporia sp. R_H_3 TaxID=1961848 RepID=UPI000B4A6EE1|nr:DUF4395 domain-containing protein [Kineosporia sp. R_H_3]
MTTPATPSGIDPRGPRFGALVTAVVLAVTVLTGSVWLLAAQTAVFAVGAFAGIGASPYGWLFRALVRPRLAPPAELEDPRPPTFSQLVGLVVTGAGLVLALLGVGGAVVVAAAVAFVAAFLNAAFGLCLGCELYLLLARLRAPRAAAQ